MKGLEAEAMAKAGSASKMLAKVSFRGPDPGNLNLEP